MLARGKVPDNKKAVGAGRGTSVGDGGKQGGSECVLPNLRDGADKRTDGPNVARRDHSSSSIRIDNLSDSTTQTDLAHLVKSLGPTKKRYLAKDKQTGLCKGFAYINFKSRNDAAKAISILDGHVIDSLALTVDWSKPLNKPGDGGLVKLNAIEGKDKNVKCSTCSSGDHEISKCPWKYTMLAEGKFTDDKAVWAGSVPSVADGGKQGGSEYVPPNLRDGAVKRTDRPNMARRDHSSFAIRITNLSDSTTQTDLEDLVKPFGSIKKLYLAKDKKTGLCKGLAYIHFNFRNDAEKAISMLDGHIFNHLILTVKWTKPLSKHEDEGLVKLNGAMGDKDKNDVKCHMCSSGDHAISKCPWKDTMLAAGKVLDDEEAVGAQSGPSVGDGDKQCGLEHVPQNLRDGAVKRSDGGDGPNMATRDHGSFAIRVGNLSGSTTQTDLEDLVKPFGPINKLYLAKNKQTGLCKGFAFIHFKFRNDAAKAISILDGHVFDHLILTVDWSKPQSSSNQ